MVFGFENGTKVFYQLLLHTGKKLSSNHLIETQKNQKTSIEKQLISTKTGGISKVTDGIAVSIGAISRF